MTLAKTNGAANPWGIVLEDVAGPLGVRITSAGRSKNEEGGLLLRNADGVVVERSAVTCNGPITDLCLQTTGIGIEVDADSDGNTFIGNRLEYNPVNVIDADTNSCWKNNSFGVGTQPPLGCP